MTTSEDVRDDLISHDVDIRRLDGDVRRQIERRIDKLNTDLRALAIQIDPHGAQRTDAKERRLVKLEKASKPIIRQAYAEIEKITDANTKRLARVESKTVVDTIEENLP